MVLCVVKGCDNKSKVYSIIMFHRIPTKNKKRKNQWLAALNIDLKTPVESIKKWRVCSEHFGPDDYLVNMDSITRTTVRRLKDTAIPTIFRIQTGPSVSSPMAETVSDTSLISQDFHSEESEEEMDHCYALTAETLQTLPRKRKKSDVKKRERDRLRQKNRVNIGVAYSRWKALKVEKGMKNDAEVACYLLDRVCGGHLLQDKSSASLRKRGRPRKSTFASAPQTEKILRDSLPPSWDMQSDTESVPSPDPQSTNVEVLEICYDLPPLWPYQPDKQAQPERLIEDGFDPDVRMGYTEEQNRVMEHSSSSSTTTEEDSAVHYEERKTALRLEERLNTMRSLSDAAPDPISMTRGIEDQKERKWTVNKSSLTGLFRTCHQCGEPVLEFKTLTSGSLIRIQWECSKGHLMWLFPNHNPT
ncbi:uncharacterized protein si:ch211-40k21.5 isoform X2 [Cyprinus carpio]|uniref:THAP domain-containing protein 1 n=1 Tax=Cyprinus carpio TaxID=7962 RepID=A0A9R0ATL4_CYPCA|nr:uncharacterized protein si:ch211-40k21.5 isoform X2 [Cyprinus carpio]